MSRICIKKSTSPQQWIWLWWLFACVHQKVKVRQWLFPCRCKLMWKFLGLSIPSEGRISMSCTSEVYNKYLENRIKKEWMYNILGPKNLGSLRCRCAWHWLVYYIILTFVTIVYVWGTVVLQITGTITFYTFFIFKMLHCSNKTWFIDFWKSARCLILHECQILRCLVLIRWLGLLVVRN